MTQYKFDLLCLDLQVIQSIRRGQQRMLLELLNRLSSCGCNDSIKQAIVARQDNIVERQELSLKHTLNTFFVEAPMV